MSNELDYFKLMRSFWDWAFENPELIKPNHCALFSFTVEHCNRLGWKNKFGLPTEMAKEAVGIRSYHTYINTLNDLVDFGFVKMVEKSKNQHSSNIIALTKFDKAHVKALDKAFKKHMSKQGQSTCQSIDSIDKPITNKQYTINQQTKIQRFDIFWSKYDKKVDKKKCRQKFLKLSDSEIDMIEKTVDHYVKSNPDRQYRKNPFTWLNGECWDDEIQEKQRQSEVEPSRFKLPL